ncbi:MAG TPA: GNAT family N-acetyltransferase [Clostridia bacterium]|nr:GNAT family N-acetyltransferase [Clostridia bacterium]
MEIRKAKPGEGAILSELALCSKAYWGYDAGFIEVCRDALTISEKYIASNYVYVLEDGSGIAGFFSMVAGDEENELDNMFILPEYIGKGYGRLLWDKLIELAKEIGIVEFTIVSDPYAEEFYRRMGALRIGEVDSNVQKDRKLPLMKVTIT